MGGYYPDGVTGNEWQIAGADEFEDERTVACQNDECEMFEEEQDVQVEISASRYSESFEFTCETCGTTREVEQDRQVEEDDPDRYRD